MANANRPNNKLDERPSGASQNKPEPTEPPVTRIA